MNKTWDNLQIGDSIYILKHLPNDEKVLATVTELKVEKKISDYEFLIEDSDFFSWGAKGKDNTLRIPYDSIAFNESESIQEYHPDDYCDLEIFPSKEALFEYLKSGIERLEAKYAKIDSLRKLLTL